jgi:hypothetical protein
LLEQSQAHFLIVAQIAAIAAAFGGCVNQNVAKMWLTIFAKVNIYNSLGITTQLRPIRMGQIGGAI